MSRFSSVLSLLSLGLALEKKVGQLLSTLDHDAQSFKWAMILGLQKLSTLQTLLGLA